MKPGTNIRLAGLMRMRVADVSQQKDPSHRRRAWRWVLLLLLVTGALCMVRFAFGQGKGRMPRIAAGTVGLAVVKADGSLWTMGLNALGSAGDGTTEDRRCLVRIGTGDDWVDVACGSGFSLALKSDGSLWAWGINGNGQLGEGDMGVTGRDHPVSVGRDHDWVRVVAGPHHSLALKSNGTLWAWGQNIYGQLGVGPAKECSAPVQVGWDRDWRAIASGLRHTVALKTDGTLWMWGRPSFTGLGDARVAKGRPVQVGAGNDWTEISAGRRHCAALKADGSLWSWGENNWGELGDGTLQPKAAPQRVGESLDWKMIGAGSSHTVALKRDGSLWAWGANDFGQLGNGTTDNSVEPVRIGKGNDWVWASGGASYSVAFKADGSLWMWGRKVVVSECQPMAWLRDMLAVYKFPFPIKLSPPRAMELVPVKIADLGAFSAETQGNAERFRGLISNARCIRGKDLEDRDGFYVHDQDHFVDLAQLAVWINRSEPDSVQVWRDEAWNMAYNISVKFKDDADRWRWVQRGIELLRDEGLRYNPNELLIYWDLALLFQRKMGQDQDDANMYYKQEWANEMAKVFGKKTPGLDELIHPQIDEQEERARLLREKYKMDPELMKEVDQRYGPLEWRLPESHAIYWAAEGLKKAQQHPDMIKAGDLIRLRRVIYKSTHLSLQRGRLITNPFTKEFKLGPNLDIIPKANDAYEQAARDDPEDRDCILRAHRNFLRDAVYFLYAHHRLAEAARWYEYLSKQYPNKPLLEGDTHSLPATLTMSEYAVNRIQGDIAAASSNDRISNAITSLLHDAYRSLTLGQDKEAARYESLAEQAHAAYVRNAKGSEKRVPMPSLDDLKLEVGNELLDPVRGLPLEACAVLRAKLGLEPEPAQLSTSSQRGLPDGVPEAASRASLRHRETSAN
jgi:alpha-tubulin suppressor-like RCC1 family protein